MTYDVFRQKSSAYVKCALVFWQAELRTPCKDVSLLSERLITGKKLIRFYKVTFMLINRSKRAIRRNSFCPFFKCNKQHFLWAMLKKTGFRDTMKHKLDSPFQSRCIELLAERIWNADCLMYRLRYM